MVMNQRCYAYNVDHNKKAWKKFALRCEKVDLTTLGKSLLWNQKNILI